jgi:hypothetical protein
MATFCIRATKLQTTPEDKGEFFNLLYGNGNLVILNNTVRCRGLCMALKTKSVLSLVCNI